MVGIVIDHNSHLQSEITQLRAQLNSTRADVTTTKAQLTTLQGGLQAGTISSLEGQVGSLKNQMKKFVTCIPEIQTEIGGLSISQNTTGGYLTSASLSNPDDAIQRAARTASRPRSCVALVMQLATSRRPGGKLVCRSRVVRKPTRAPSGARSQPDSHSNDSTIGRARTRRVGHFPVPRCVETRTGRAQR